MRRLTLFAVAGLLMSLTPAANAAPAPAGLGCGMVAEYTSATAAPYNLTAVVWGGPVALSDSNPAIVYSGQIVCTVQVNAPRHSDPDICVFPGPTTGVVAALPPATCAFAAGPFDTVFVCTQLELIGGGTLYASGGSWTTNASSTCDNSITVMCAAITPGCVQNPTVLLDPLLCPIFSALAPGVPGVVDIWPDGDIVVLGQPFWDCPPYAAPISQNEFTVHVVVPSPVT